MKENLSPEEKLLRLIRNQKRPELTPQLNRSPTVKIKPTPILKYPDFLSMRKALWVAFIASYAYLAVSWAYPLFTAKEEALTQMKEEGAPAKITLPKDNQPYAFYSAGANNKKLFASLAPQNAKEGAAVILGDELIKEINLVGIISGENAQAVIEDKKTQKTYYVTKGQLIGNFQLEDIQDGKIILGSSGQKYELFL